jgi:hypothetical protein
MTAGYYHPAYVASLRHVGEPVRLKACGGWLLRRSIAGGPLYDYAGPYPLFCCARWPALAEDLMELRDAGAVSVTLVPDPFGGYSQACLESVFDVVSVAKPRWVLDLRTDLGHVVSLHHQRNAQRALAHIHVERCAEPQQYAKEWSRCYRTFVDRRDISGPAAFPERSLVEQLSIPGLLMYRASSGGHTLGFSLWMVQGTSAYGHLAASTDQGRHAGVAYAFYWTILRELQVLGVELVDLGGGVEDGDGLARWKSGWTRDSRPTVICGAILRPEEYGELTRSREVVTTPYFPSYRAAGHPERPTTGSLKHPPSRPAARPESNLDIPRRP